MAILRVDVGAVVKQQPHNLIVISNGSCPECSPPMATLRVNVGAVIKQ